MKALVLSGDGINCERETAQALRDVGFAPEIIPISDGPERARLDRFALVALPGGFSFGDDLGSGRVLALRIRRELKWDLAAYARAGGMAIGICNGFQALLRLGAFGAEVSITHNVSRKFLNTWVTLAVDPAAERGSPWLRGIQDLELPIRHGEGRVVYQKPPRVALRYEGDPNGSQDRIAGLVDETGRILGLMPHPEAGADDVLHPWFFEGRGRADGRRLFENAWKELNHDR